MNEHELYAEQLRAEGRTDFEIACVMRGIKLGLIAGSRMSVIEAMREAAKVTDVQKKMDPDGSTWEKGS